MAKYSKLQLRVYLMTTPSSGRGQLRLAIMGSGYMGRTYAECLTKYNTRSNLVAVYGGSRAPKLASDYGVDHVATLNELLRRPDIDALVIATPPGNHPEHVIGAAEHGKHAMVEKPMAPTHQKCEEMITACSKAGVTLEVLQVERWRSTNATAKKTIEQGILGDVRMIRGHTLFPGYEAQGAWAKLPEHGGPLLDLTVHSFDILRYIAEAEPASIFSTITTFNKHPLGGLTDMSQVLFRNGAIAQNWACMEMPPPSLPNSFFGYVVVGEKGILDVDSYGKVKLGQGDDWRLLHEFPKIDYINRPMDPQRLQPFIAAMQSFIDDVLDERPPTVSGNDGKIAVEMVDAAKLSSEKGEAVKLPLTT
jgi:predicted dehydrogenase